MPKYKVRRQILGMTGADIGGTSNYSQFSSTGRLTMAGTARVKKDQWIEPESFLIATTSGSWESASMEVDITGSTWAGVSGSLVSLKYAGPAANVAGSPTTAFAKVPKPYDADTSGSIDVWVEWTANESLANSPSVTCIKAAMAYFGSGSTVRTAASCGASPQYDSDDALVWHSSSLGTLPSWTDNDSWGVFVIRHDISETDETMGASTFRIAGVRLRYTACALGVASTE